MFKLTNDTSQWFTVTKLIEWLNNNKIELSKKILDIGAHDGKFLSNSYPFIAENDFYGILVEPNPQSFIKIRQNLEGHKYTAYNVGMSDKNTTVSLNLPENDPTLGSMYIPSKYKVDIVLQDFKQFAEQMNLSDIGILSIDTEGHDIVVLNRIINDTDVRPKIIITESWPWNVQPNTFKDLLLTNNGYEKFLNVEENDFYILK